MAGAMHDGDDGPVRWLDRSQAIRLVEVNAEEMFAVLTATRGRPPMRFVKDDQDGGARTPTCPQQPCDKCGSVKALITAPAVELDGWRPYRVCPNCDIDRELSRLLSDWAEIRKRRCQCCDEGYDDGPCTCLETLWLWECIEEQMGQLEALRPSRREKEGRAAP